LVPDLFGLGTAAGSVLSAPTGEAIRFGHLAYSTALEDTFLASAYAEGVPRARRVYGATPLGKVAANGSLTGFPLPVITATARSEQQGGRCAENATTRPWLRDSVIEFSPTRVHYALSSAYGAVRLTLAEIAAMAGAALSDPFAKHCDIRESFNVSLLRTVEVPGTPGRLAITDGGFSENLAAYPLIQRLCRTTVIIDGEHDPRMEFEALRRLEIGLTAEGVGSAGQPGGLCMPGELKPYRAIKNGVGEAELEQCPRPDREFRGTHWPRPVFELRVGSYPFAADHDSRVKDLDLRIVYVKLSMDAVDCSKGGGSLHHKRYCEEQKQGKVSCTKNLLAEDCAFPQQSTFYQCFKGDDFEAYKSLGREHGLTAAEKIRAIPVED
jgi:hypothetical protein